MDFLSEQFNNLPLSAQIIIGILLALISLGIFIAFWSVVLGLIIAIFTATIKSLKYCFTVPFYFFWGLSKKINRITDKRIHYLKNKNLKKKQNANSGNIPTDTLTLVEELIDLDSYNIFDDHIENDFTVKENGSSKYGKDHCENGSVGDIEQYKIEAGMKAELEFDTQAIQAGYYMEPLVQDKESYHDKCKAIFEKSVKRGDYICRNLRNIEIDVKCISHYPPDNPEYFYLDYSDLTRHMEMFKQTRTPILFAIYQMDNKAPKLDTLKMITLDDILLHIKKNSIKKGSRYNGVKIPLNLTSSKFSLLDKIREELYS